MKYTISLAFLTITFLYSLILNIMFFTKKHIDTNETRIFGQIVVTNFFGIILESLCIMFLNVFGNENSVTIIINKAFLVYFLTIMYLFTKYVINVSRLSKVNTKANFFFKYSEILSRIAYVISIIAVIFLKIKLFNEKGISYSYGAAVNVVYFMSALTSIICITYLIINFKNLKQSRNIPIVAFVIIMGIAAIIQQLHPEITIATTMETLIIFIMYHTIENPDLKMLNEVTLAKNQVEKSNKVKSEFISSMSHEIRTPLNAIVGYSQMIDFAENLSDAKENSKEIVNASNTLLNMLSNVLDISMVEVNELDIKEVEYNLDEIIKDTTDLFKYKIEEKGLKFKLDIQKLENNLIGDPDKIKRIVANLIDNAIKYTEKGKVVLSIKNKIKNQKCELTITVEDTGIGIDSKNLFSNFNRSDKHMDSHISGMGLGLSITKSLIEMMNGKITYESVVGKGTKFIIKLNQKVGSKE